MAMAQPSVLSRLSALGATSNPFVRKYLTDQPASSSSLRVFCLPDGVYPAFMDVLSILLNEYAWEQSEGGISPRAQVQIMHQLHLQISRGFDEMLGFVSIVFRAELPDYCIWLDGATYHKDVYPDFWEVCLPAWKSGDNFTVPNFDEIFPLATTNPAKVGETGGSATHTLSIAEMPTHHHAYDPVIVGDLDVEGAGVPQPNAAQIVPLVTENTYDEGGGEAHNNMPPFYRVRFAIVVKKPLICGG